MRNPSHENLNALGREYCSLPPESSAQRKKLLEEIYEMAFKLFPRGAYYKPKDGQTIEETDAWAELFIKDMPKYDADKGPLTAFITSRLAFRAQNIYYKDAGIRRVKDEEGKRKYQCRPSIEEPIRPKDEKQDALNLGDMVSFRDWEESPIDAPARDSSFEASFLAIVQLALNFSEHLTGRANNSQRRTYFRMFFTDDMVWAVQDFNVGEDAFHHEKDLFNAMKLPFLDYFMNSSCRSVEQLRTCPLKMHGEVVPGKPMEELSPHYLPSDVYKGYINANEDFEIRSDGAISNQREAYHSFFRDQLR